MICTRCTCEMLAQSGQAQKSQVRSDALHVLCYGAVRYDVSCYTPAYAVIVSGQNFLLIKEKNALLIDIPLINQPVHPTPSILQTVHSFLF